MIGRRERRYQRRLMLREQKKMLRSMANQPSTTARTGVHDAYSWRHTNAYRRLRSRRSNTVGLT